MVTAHTTCARTSAHAHTHKAYQDGNYSYRSNATQEQRRDEQELGTMALSLPYSKGKKETGARVEKTVWEKGAFAVGDKGRPLPPQTPPPTHSLHNENLGPQETSCNCCTSTQGSVVKREDSDTLLAAHHATEQRQLHAPFVEPSRPPPHAPAPSTYRHRVWSAGTEEASSTLRARCQVSDPRYFWVELQGEQAQGGDI